jgi:methyltransferase
VAALIAVPIGVELRRPGWQIHSCGDIGKHWNPWLIVISDAPLAKSEPCHWLHHPNSTAVIAEVTALPLVHSAWLTAIVFRIAMNVRIRTENWALGYV